jgi:hypothetical protein
VSFSHSFTLSFSLGFSFFSLSFSLSFNVSFSLAGHGQVRAVELCGGVGDVVRGSWANNIKSRGRGMRSGGECGGGECRGGGECGAGGVRYGPGLLEVGRVG